MADVDIQQIHKSFGKVDVLMGVDLAIDDGEFIVLLGPSGCGKSTLLRILAGLEDQTSGAISINGQAVDHLPPAKRDIAMVFQTYALYPHLNVAGNWSLGLKQAGEPKSLIDERITEASRVLELDDLLERRPAELSGGQRQRVAIGRAIVRHPAVFLFDEPLSNLDAALRSQVRFEIAHLHKRLSATMIYVTHDQIEAMTLASRIVVLHEGKVQQIGTPHDLYRAPQNRFVAGFIGSPQMNMINGQHSGTRVDFGAAGCLNVPPPGQAGQTITMGVRADAITALMAGDPTINHPGAPVLQATVTLSEYLGRQSYLHAALDNGAIMVIEVEADHEFALGDRIGLKIDHQAVHWFDGERGERITA